VHCNRQLRRHLSELPIPIDALSGELLLQSLHTAEQIRHNLRAEQIAKLSLSTNHHTLKVNDSLGKLGSYPSNAVTINRRSGHSALF